MFQYLVVSLVIFSSSASANNNSIVIDDFENQTAVESSQANSIASENPTFQSIPSQITLSQLITLGEHVWNFIVNNRPSVQYQAISSSIVPSGITNWNELQGWQVPVTKVYEKQIKNFWGYVTRASLRYRITFVPGGSYNGKGKYLGEISLVPITLRGSIGQNVKLNANLSSPLNYGTDSDPIATTHLVVTWSKSGILSDYVDSAEYLISGTGEITEL